MSFSEHRTSVSLSPIAIARHNLEGQSSFHSKIEVWIAYMGERNGNSDMPKTIMNNLQTISKEANQIFNNTVTTILLPSNTVKNLIESKALPNNQEYNIGVLLQSNCQNESWGPSNASLTPYLIRGTFVPIEKYLTENTNISLVCPECKLFSKCQSKDKTMSSGYIVSIPDTYQQNIANMTRQILLWNKLNDWSNSGTTVIFSKVFDTPYKNIVEAKTSGWWRLLENSEYKSTKDYNFAEKYFEANSFDLQESKINIRELENAKKDNNYTYVGVIFSASTMTRSAYTPYSDMEMQSVLFKTSKMFSKLLFLIDSPEQLKLETLRFELRTASIFHPKKEGILMVSPHAGLLPFPAIPLLEAAGTFHFDPYLLTTFIVSYIGESTKFQVSKVQKLLNGGFKNSQKFGYAFNVSLCQSFEINKTKEYELVWETLQDKRASVIVFYFEEDKETVKLGAERMFQQRIVELEQCKWFLEKQNVSDKLSINFLMLHYATELNFYKNPWEMQKYVNYWKRLANWAENTSTSVIMNNAMDGARYFGSRNKFGHSVSEFEIGWWRLQDNENQSNMWIDKREDTVQTAKLHFAKKAKPVTATDISSNMIILYALIILLICFIVITVVVGILIRQHYIQRLNKNDLTEFYNGGGGNNDQSYYLIPYDKKRLEVCPGLFSLEEGGLLGKGEFGMVWKGQILEGSSTKIVAIKMPNPLNTSKTTLKGMLSEIKVLTFVGKHANIIELLGANTSDLQHGKLYIFLEYCQLGSLQTYLQKRRKEVEDEINSVERCSLDGLAGPNAESELLCELLPKMHRWSREICRGMAHLASKQVVHADLATRNVLLNGNEEAKISDFGLSRRMYNYKSYVKQQQEPLPWKWMAPESLRLLTFNEKTDVWAYGITLWEIYSLGGIPYEGLSYETEFVQTLQLGFRLGKPQFNERGM